MRKTLGSIGRNAVGGLALLTLVSGCVPTATGRNNLNLLGSIATNALIDEGVRDAVRNNNQNVQQVSQVNQQQNPIVFSWLENEKKEKHIVYFIGGSLYGVIIDDRGNVYMSVKGASRTMIPEGEAIMIYGN